MFTFQPTSGKRTREDDSDSDFEDDRYMKKSRPTCNNHISNVYPSPSSLPFRPSFPPSPPRVAGDHVGTTPAHCGFGWSNSPDSMISPGFPAPSQSNSMDFDMDMDEEADDVRSQPPESPALSSFGSMFMRPAMLQTSLAGPETTNTGRMPTPIRPTFRRSGMNGLTYPLSGSAGSLNSTNSHFGASTSSAQTPPIWNPNRQGAEHDRRHRMPSPISEDEDIPDTPTALTQSQLSRLSFSQSNSTDQMDTESSTSPLAPPPSRGRKRSGALTGMGRFSMGYRDDCEKCRQRVPGHYSHFLS